MPLTQAERNFARVTNEYLRAAEHLVRARTLYAAAVAVLRRERGMPPFQPFGPLNRNFMLEESVMNKGARTIQRAARSVATRRRVAFAGTPFARSLPRNLVRTRIMRRN